MSLYNQYAPKNFKEILGQRLIIKILQNICKEQDLLINQENFFSQFSVKIPNGIIFSGVFGVGKTSLARIFVKAINCLGKNEEKPCNNCKNCQVINSGSEDIMETDCATNTGIDNIRFIQDQAQYFPKELRYKVYIIDEVHMLSMNAFESLLKTLEK